MANFGSTFKKARESKGLTLAQIADETRISTRFLVAIESEEFNLLPGGIFNRGFIKTYAARLGLDVDATIEEYERVKKAQEPEPQQPVQPEVPREKSPKALYPIAIAALAVAIIVFYMVTRESAPQGPLPQQPAVAVVPEPVTPPTPPSITSAVSAAPEPEPIPQQTAGIKLDIEAVEQTWIKVNADGTNILAGEILEPGMTRQFTAESLLNVIVGNAGGLNLKLNDQKMKTIGKSGQIRQLVITPENFKDFLG